MFTLEEVESRPAFKFRITQCIDLAFDVLLVAYFILLLLISLCLRSLLGAISQLT